MKAHAIKSKLMKVTRALAAVCLLALPMAGAQASELDDIISSGTFKVAVPQDFAPFGSVGKDMQPEGYDVDVAGLIAKELGVELKLVPVTSANRIPYLVTKKVDLVISSLGVNPQRAKTIAFSQAYAPFFSGVYAYPDTAIAGFADLKGKAVGVTRGSLEDLELTQRAPEGTTIRRFEDNSVTVAALMAKKVDAIVTGNVVAAKVIQDNPESGIESKFVIKESPCHIGLRRGDNDLRRWVDSFIYTKKLSGELDELSKKWFGQPLPQFSAL